MNVDKPERPFYTREKFDGPNPSSQSYPEETRRQRPYEEPGNRGNYSERDTHARPYADQSGGRRPQANLDRRQYSSGDGHSLVARDVQENIYLDDMPRNRHNDKDLRMHSAAQRSGDSQYQEGRMYSAYEGREPGMDATSKHSRSFHEEERHGTAREFDRTMHGYHQRFKSGDDPRSYSEETIPTKKKRKSRFSDATAEEIAVVHLRLDFFIVIEALHLAIKIFIIFLQFVSLLVTVLVVIFRECCKMKNNVIYFILKAYI